jgi:integrase
MQASITADLVKKLKPAAKPYEVWDLELRGFVLRVQPSGIKTYLVEYARHRRITIGQTTAISAARAREQARDKIADHIKGNDPIEARNTARAHTLESFIADRYRDHIETRQSSAKETLRRIKAFYPDLGKKKLPEITAWVIEKIRTARLKGGVTNSTVNRDMDALRGALSKAVDWGLLKAHPMRTVKNAKLDDPNRVRYLDPAEESRLRTALQARDNKNRQEREKFNAWRRERGYTLFPELGTYSDHLTPIVLTALNTGMRRGELLKLKWANVDFVKRILTVIGKTAKGMKTRHIPLNDEAYEVLTTWRKQNPENILVFPGRNGEVMGHIKTSWGKVMKDAKVKDFHFHDCRHDFASKLVMAGEDLNTVRELLGHSDIKMTLRYAHLAPSKLTAAVAKLGVR